MTTFPPDSVREAEGDGAPKSANLSARFPTPASADMRLAFALLLAGLSSRLFALVLGEASLVLLLACVFRRCGLAQRDGNRLTAALDLAAAPSGTALEFAMLEFVHDAASGLPLTW